MHFFLYTIIYYVMIINCCLSQVRLFTRFTEEIFTGLISILYIVETFMKLINYFKRNPLWPEYCFDHGNATTNSSLGQPLGVAHQPGLATELALAAPDNVTLSAGFMTYDFVPDRDQQGNLINQPNTALMCTILCLGTFLGAYYLRIFRNSHYLGRSARRAFGDFGVPISIVVFVLIDYLAGVKTEKLLVPEGLSPTIPERSWLVSPTKGGVPAWMALACCVPALLAYILVFMETQISE